MREAGFDASHAFVEEVVVLADLVAERGVSGLYLVGQLDPGRPEVFSQAAQLLVRRPPSEVVRTVVMATPVPTIVPMIVKSVFVSFVILAILLRLAGLGGWRSWVGGGGDSPPPSAAPKSGSCRSAWSISAIVAGLNPFLPLCRWPGLASGS